ncbi:MAG: integrase core domain-containing protein [Pseudomonadota bacterium]|nr:integrase core domain-containing protein [Pseudomonadota bacterium]
MLILLAWLWIQVKAWFAHSFQSPRGRHGRRHSGESVYCRTQAKPPWVTNEIIRLKALIPDAGCRTLALIFNRRYAVSRKITVGKSFVADTMRKHRHEIEVVRRRIKHRVPPTLPRNLVWGLDLTGKSDTQGKLHMILGLLDHGSRGLLTLAALPNKCSWTLLGHLFLAIGHYGKPRALRTDNESCFTSRVFRAVLLLAGIRQQRSDPGCPWQNGRIERLFGTLKQKLDQWEVAGFEALNHSLGEFRFFYNHIRPHQHLQGWTPAEAWTQVDPYARPIKTEYWFEAWEGLLQGYYLRR